jgi:pseudouridine synthase
MPSKPREAQPMRLHRYIAQCGVTSRRKAEELITEGRVEVNGQRIRILGFKVSPSDKVAVDGEEISLPPPKVVAMYKPIGYVTTLDDPQGRPTVAKLLPDQDTSLKPVGRLDMDTDGLILFTNDGDLAMRLAHPRYEIDKEYNAILKGKPEEAVLEKLRKGVTIEGRKTAPAKVIRRRYDPGEDQTAVKIIIHEGRNRQIRLMGESVGHPVVELRRMRIGFVSIKGMRSGECRLIGQKDVNRLRELVGLSANGG